ncbi:MAG: glycoside hydrolase family 1 protein [Cyanobacteria bacterium Co-bin8]|nr:glycoside hydrolase family 1 protein [Cyanobacteria bacterium Co-bin8]
MSLPTDSPISPSQPFLWGVSTSGYQHEGGYNGPDQPQNNWTWWEQSGRVEETGDAARFWQHYPKDFQNCREMGLNGFRLSIEWPRVQPTTTAKRGAAPEFDYGALDGYCDRIAACRQSGLEPVVTLQHFTHPAWLGLDAWLSADTIKAYLAYVQVTVTHINRRLVDHHQMPPLHWYITLNEPNILISNTYLKGDFPGEAWGPGAALRGYNHMLAAHVQAYNLIHDLYEAAGWPRPQVALNTYCSDLYWSEKVIWDLLDLRQHPVNADTLRDYLAESARSWEKSLQAAELPQRQGAIYQIGRGLRRLANRIGQQVITGAALSETYQALEASPRPRVFDFIGLDYYDPFFAHSFQFPPLTDLTGGKTDFRGRLMAGISRKWWDWHVLPEGLFFFCQEYSQTFDHCPIMIAENGMALQRTFNNHTANRRTDGLSRSEFLTAHLEQVKHLQQAGVPLLGYFHWSLIDNYEWGSYTPRFGLFAVDYMNGAERQQADHLGDCPAETYAKLIRDSAQ